MFESPLSFELVSKILLLPVAASALALVFRRRSASVQHLVLVAGLVALVALPLLAALTPTWSLGDIPGTPEAVVRWSSVETVVDSAAVAIARPAASRSLPFVSLSELVAIAWLAGALTFALRWLVSHRRSVRILRQAEVERSVRLRSTVEEVAQRLGLRRRVVLMRSGRAQTPFTIGSLRPRIVLPSDAEEWSPERLQMVLLHELSHVVRLDVVAQHLSSLATAVYWFHPLVWWMSRRLRAAAERAADDGVLRSGASAPDYAEQLVLLARQYRSPAPGAPAVSGGPFEERLEALLVEGGRRVSFGAARGVLALASALVLTLAVSACSRTEAAPAAKKKKAEQAEAVLAEAKKLQAGSGRQILLDTVIVETKEALVDWDALGDAARGDGMRLISFGDDSQRLELRLQQGEREGKLKILASPKLLTVDGEPVSAQSGLQVPVQTTQNGAITTQFVNATLRIDMTPFLVEDDVVLVEVSLQKRFPRLELAENAVNAPIATTEVRAKFRVRLGGTVVIAGLRHLSQAAEQDLLAFVTVREIEL